MFGSLLLFTRCIFLLDRKQAYIAQDGHISLSRHDFRYLLVGEDISGNQMDLGVAVLTSLGGGHFNDLTGSSLDDNVAVLSQGRTLHGVGLGGTGISGLEGVVVIVISHTIGKKES